MITSKASVKTSEKNPECQSEQLQYGVIIFRSCTKFIVAKLVLIFLLCIIYKPSDLKITSIESF